MPICVAAQAEGVRTRAGTWAVNEAEAAAIERMADADEAWEAELRARAEWVNRPVQPPGLGRSGVLELAASVVELRRQKQVSSSQEKWAVLEYRQLRKGCGEKSRWGNRTVQTHPKAACCALSCCQFNVCMCLLVLSRHPTAGGCIIWRAVCGGRACPRVCQRRLHLRLSVRFMHGMEWRQGSQELRWSPQRLMREGPRTWPGCEHVLRLCRGRRRCIQAHA